MGGERRATCFNHIPPLIKRPPFGLPPDAKSTAEDTVDDVLVTLTSERCPDVDAGRLLADFPSGPPCT